MGFWDSAKKLFAVTDDDEYEDNYREEDEIAGDNGDEDKPASKGGFFSGRNAPRTVDTAPSQMQVVLVKPERFDDGISVADYLNENKTVVLNLENANRDTCRRLLDFLSGAAYIRRGNIKKVAKSTYIITPVQVNVMGEMLTEEYEDAGLYL